MMGECVHAWAGLRTVAVCSVPDPLGPDHLSSLGHSRHHNLWCLRVICLRSSVWPVLGQETPPPQDRD